MTIWVIDLFKRRSNNDNKKGRRQIKHATRHNSQKLRLVDLGWPQVILAAGWEATAGDRRGWLLLFINDFGVEKYSVFTTGIL